ncbi:hypothetical protein GVN18_29505 [Pseudomonas sp. ODNR1LW]|nr:hypothetical protein [Pseudomonas sp. ODNR1LW]
MRELKGVVAPDPTKAGVEGLSVQFQAKLFLPISSPTAGELVEWDHFGSTLLAVGFRIGDQFAVEGSAVMIGPGLALSARHVLEPHLPQIMASKHVPILAAITPDGLQLWAIKQVILNDHDVVILRIDLCSALPSSGEIEMAGLTTRLPRPGEIVQIAGFRATGTHRTGVSGQVRVGIGEVTDVFPLRRDSVLLPHPCFSVRCLTLGGMSGGPAFDADGHLLGVLTSSVEHNEGPSTVSLAWPVFCSAIETFWFADVVELPTSIARLAAQGLIQLEKPEAYLEMSSTRGQLTQWTER